MYAKGGSRWAKRICAADRVIGLNSQSLSCLPAEAHRFCKRFVGHLLTFRSRTFIVAFLFSLTFVPGFIESTANADDRTVRLVRQVTGEEAKGMLKVLADYQEQSRSKLQHYIAEFSFEQWNGAKTRWKSVNWVGTITEKTDGKSVWISRLEEVTRENYDGSKESQRLDMYRLVNDQFVCWWPLSTETVYLYERDANGNFQEEGFSLDRITRLFCSATRYGYTDGLSGLSGILDERFTSNRVYFEVSEVEDGLFTVRVCIKGRNFPAKELTIDSKSGYLITSSTEWETEPQYIFRTVQAVPKEIATGIWIAAKWQERTFGPPKDGATTGELVGKLSGELTSIDLAPSFSADQFALRSLELGSLHVVQRFDAKGKMTPMRMVDGDLIPLSVAPLTSGTHVVPTDSGSEVIEQGEDGPNLKGDKGDEAN